MLSPERLARLTFSERNREKSIQAEVDIRARLRQSQDAKISYRDAVRSVFTADPELHSAYLDDV